MDEEIESRKNDPLSETKKNDLLSESRKGEQLLSDEYRENSTRKPLVRRGFERQQVTREQTFNNHHEIFRRAMTRVYPETNHPGGRSRNFDDIEMKLTKRQRFHQFVSVFY